MVGGGNFEIQRFWTVVRAVDGHSSAWPPQGPGMHCWVRRLAIQGISRSDAGLCRAKKKARLRKARRLLIVPFKTKLLVIQLLALDSPIGGAVGGSLPGHAFMAGDQRFRRSGYQYLVVNEVAVNYQRLRYERRGCQDLRFTGYGQHQRYKKRVLAWVWIFFSYSILQNGRFHDFWAIELLVRKPGNAFLRKN